MSRWTVRVIPFVLSGCVGFATYVVVDRICGTLRCAESVAHPRANRTESIVDYLMRTSSQIGAAIVILVLYFVLFLLVLATYLRTFLIIQFDPGVVPYGPEPYESKRDRRRRMRGEKSDASPRELRSERDPDSPGLEEFYRRDVFVCENDGLPRFCSECRAWKPDRAHHSSELNRCVYKMDHFCPWVGGIVSENCELRRRVVAVESAKLTDIKLSSSSCNSACGPPSIVPSPWLQLPITRTS